jgi:hypothetical protein
MSGKRTITIEVSATVYALLEVLGRDPYFAASPAPVEAVVVKLVDHAQQGVYRPGSWERGWLEQAFGSWWQAHLEPGDPHGRPGCEGIFQRPRKTPPVGPDTRGCTCRFGACDVHPDPPRIARSNGDR